MAEALTFERVAAVIEHRDGTLYWKVASGRARAGAECGSINEDGYRQLWLDGRNLLGHRVVWLLCTGAWPATDLDHRDTDRSNNRLENLRPCTQSQNNANANGRNKYKGVTLHKQTGKYQAALGRAYLGLYAEPESAARAYDAAALQHFGEFARLNFGSAT